MPHTRHRYLIDAVWAALGHSSLVGVLGQRQVGKTTLLESVSTEYLSFDRVRLLEQANADAELFLAGRKLPCGIDEAQLCPAIFPALKEWVRTRKQRGQFILSGSVRFTSKASIRESLTGRIVSLELLPFTVAEAAGLPLPDICGTILRAKKEASLSCLGGRGASAGQFERYLMHGGLPGICFYRDEHVRNSRFDAHLDTLLNRDMRQVYPTTLLADSLKALLRHLASNQGRPFVIGEASRASQISTVTLKRVLFALEALFLIRMVPCEGEARPTIFLEDQGMATWLTGRALVSADDIIRGLYANLRQELHYRPAAQGRIFQWRSRNGADVPLAFASSSGTIGFVATMSREPAAKTLGSAQGFLRRFPRAKVVVAYGGNDIIFKTPAMVWIPYWLMC